MKSVRFKTNDNLCDYCEKVLNLEMNWIFRDPSSHSLYKFCSPLCKDNFQLEDEMKIEDGFIEENWDVIDEVLRSFPAFNKPFYNWRWAIFSLGAVN